MHLWAHNKATVFTAMSAVSCTTSTRPAWREGGGECGRREGAEGGEEACELDTSYHKS